MQEENNYIWYQAAIYKTVQIFFLDTQETGKYSIVLYTLTKYAIVTFLNIY